MPLVNLSFKHGHTLHDARVQLDSSVDQLTGQFPAIIQRVEWSEDRGAVRLAGAGFEIRIRVDPEEVHVSGDIPLLAKVLAGPLMSRLKGVLEENFQKRLT